MTDLESLRSLLSSSSRAFLEELRSSWQSAVRRYGEGPEKPRL